MDRHAALLLSLTLWAPACAAPPDSPHVPPLRVDQRGLAERLNMAARTQEDAEAKEGATDRETNHSAKTESQGRVDETPAEDDDTGDKTADDGAEGRGDTAETEDECPVDETAKGAPTGDETEDNAKDDVTEPAAKDSRQPPPGERRPPEERENRPTSPESSQGVGDDE